MRTKLVVLLTCIFVVALSSCWAAPLITREFTLPAIDGRSFRPRISGDWIVAIHNTKDNKQQLGLIIYSISKSQVYTIYREKPAGWPSISGNLVGWPGKSDSIDSLVGTRGQRGRLPSSLIMLDLAAGRYSCPELQTISAFSVAMSPGYVAYELGCRIYLLNLSNGQQRRISDNEPHYRNPEIAGDIVVWEEFTDSKDPLKDRRIKGYRISTGQNLTIYDDGADHYTPRTDGRTVVCTSKTGVEIYDVATGGAFSIPKAFFADVDNGIVVYLKPTVSSSGQCMCGKSSVYGYDLAKKTEFKISTTTADQGPSIDNGRVIWCMEDKLYCAQLDLKASDPARKKQLSPR